MASDDEFILLERTATGETEAFRILFEAHHEAVFRVAFRLTNEREVAEDINSGLLPPFGVQSRQV